MVEFIKLGDVPAIPGSLKSTPHLERALQMGEVEMGLEDHPVGLDRVGQIIGATLIYKVEPPTPARAVEVAYPLVENHSLTTARKVIFMQSVLQGAMERALH